MADTGQTIADVAKLADAPDLESGAARRGGSSPSIRTTNNHSILVSAWNQRFWNRPAFAVK